MMYVFNIWNEISSTIKSAKHILLVLDYDGTITSIAGTPDLAVPAEDIRNTIRTLANHQFFTVGIISGRSLDDVKKKVAINGVYYGGNHGLEIEGPEMKFTSPDAKKLIPLMFSIEEKLTEGLKDTEGVFVENKKLSLSIHYRQAREKEVGITKDVFYNVLKPLVDKGRLKVVGGDKVLEVRPLLELNKGKALLWVIRNLSRTHPHILPLYIGSALTDESAFKIVNKKKGMSIFVGKRDNHPSTDYYLKSPKDVRLFLEKVKNTVDTK